MQIDEWWPKLSVTAREWLVANNGDVLPAWVLSEIEAAGGGPDSGAWSPGETVPSGFTLSDRAIDWIEDAANDER